MEWTYHRFSPHPLKGLQADFTGVFRCRFSYPDDPATRKICGVLIEDEFDDLARPNSGNSTHAKAVWRRIQKEAGNSFRVAMEVDDETCPTLADSPL